MFAVPCLRISSAGYGEITTPDYPSSPLYGECVWYIDVLEGVAKIAVEPTTTSTDSSSCTMSQLAVCVDFLLIFSKPSEICLSLVSYTREHSGIQLKCLLQIIRLLRIFVFVRYMMPDSKVYYPPMRICRLSQLID